MIIKKTAKIKKQFLKSIGKIFFGVILIIYGILVGAYGFIFLGTTAPAENITWGATFGHSQAQDLGLDWKETYITLLDEVGVRNFRVPVYWNELEATRGEYDFTNWDWQLEELEKRGGSAILVVGFKLPRWPECRFPDWYNLDDNQATKDKPLFQMIRKVVAHYRDNPTVIAWQVENEPLLEFGVCPEADKELLDAEIKLVRGLDDSRPIIISDTGEWSFWIEAGKRADIVGSTLYRVIHDSRLGFVEYKFIEPKLYAQKERFLHLWKPNVKVIVSELQAEPWVKDVPISRWSIEEQNKTMSPEQFDKNIQFAKDTGIDTFYLWGAEWWVWLRAQGEVEIFEKVVKLFNK